MTEYNEYKNEGCVWGFKSAITVEKIEQMIEAQKIKADQESIDKYHKGCIGGVEDRELDRLKVLLSLLKAGVKNIKVSQGCAYIQEGDTTFRFCLLKRKWSSVVNPSGQRVSWKNRARYRCKTPEDFVKNYVLKLEEIGDE